VADKTTTYAIKVKGESNADDTAGSVQRLQKELAGSETAVKQYAAALRNLKGGSEAVKSTKERLTAAVKAEKDKISQSTLALLQYNASLKATKPPTNEAKAATDELKGALEFLGSAWGVALAAATAFAVGLVASTVSLVKFVFEGANALRTMGLFREAALGSAQNAYAMGTQIDALGAKVPQTRAELNQLAVSLSRALVGTRFSGQGIVDTFNAVAQASAAMGDQVGNKIEEIITRGKRFGRFSLGLFDLEGTGLGFTDVAQQLSKDLRIGLGAAKQQLVLGRANVNAGAKALREVVERQFGDINMRRMLDLDILSKKFKDTLVGLTSDVDLTPLLGGIREMFELFSATTTTGKSLKLLITDFGNGVAAVFKAAAPFVTTFVQAFVVEMLRLELAGLKVVGFIKEKFGVDITNALGDTTAAIYVAKAAMIAIGGVIVGVAAGVARLGEGFFVVYGAVQAVKQGVKDLKEAFAGDWAAVGRSIVQGLIGGLTGNSVEVFHAVAKLSAGMRDHFKKLWGISSPSKVGFVLGAEIPRGVAGGVESETDTAQRAIAGMAPQGSITVKAAGGGGNSNVFNIAIHVEGGRDAAKTLTSPGFKAQILKVLEEAVIGAGLAPQGKG
jgi:hypothetical protein